MRVFMIAVLALVGCKTVDQDLEAMDHSSTESHVSGGSEPYRFVFLEFPDDRDFDQMKTLDTIGHNPKEMKAGPALAEVEGTNLEEKPRKIRIQKCKTVSDCGEKEGCLRPAGGPHPYGLCGTPAAAGGIPNPNAALKTCGGNVRCPSHATCVLAYGDWGVCYR